ncbi:MAG: hypothetical protein RIT43_1645, partial [Bacteroidota bacterium]
LLPLDVFTTIEKIEKHQQEVNEAHAGEPVIIHLTEDFDLSRGSSIVKTSEVPNVENTIEATVCWMDNKPFQNGQKLLLQQNSFRSKAIIKEVDATIDIHTFEDKPSDGSMNLNEFCKVTIKTAEAITYDPYQLNRKTGAFILINENTNNTVAAGIIH